jgi:hypothetical protein
VRIGVVPTRRAATARAEARARGGTSQPQRQARQRWQRAGQLRDAEDPAAASEAATAARGLLRHAESRTAASEASTAARAAAARRCFFFCFAKRTTQPGEELTVTAHRITVDFYPTDG